MIKVSNSFDPDQNRSSVSPDLGPNCLKRLSADDKHCHHFQISATGTISECQMFFDPDQDQQNQISLSVLIWVQTVFKGYQ